MSPTCPWEHLRDEADEMWNLRDALWTLIRRLRGGLEEPGGTKKNFPLYWKDETSLGLPSVIKNA